MAAPSARNQSGLSLVETMVAVVVFSIAIVFLSQMLFSGRVQVELEGERRMGLKLVELKVEELRHAGYSSSGSDSDWTSLNLNVGQHPVDPQVLMDDRGTETGTDDLVGSMTWTVRDTSWFSDGVTTECKTVRIDLEWPEAAPRDMVSVITMVGK